MSIPNPNKTRTWDRSTPNDGLFFDAEYTSLYANDNSLQTQIANLQAQIDSLNNTISQVAVPLGGVIEFDFPNIPANFLVANGQAVSRTTFSALWTLIHRTISGLTPATGKVQSMAHGLIAGQLVKFSFTGGGITTNTPYYVVNPTANDFQISLTPGGAVIPLTSNQTGDLISHIQYGFGDGSTTFTLPDRRGVFARGSGQHASRAKAAGGNYDGGAIGQENQDMFQGHRHANDGISASLVHPDNYFGTGSSRVGQNGVSILDPTIDGTNGIPRTGAETSPVSTAVQYIIRVI
ncbi:hypothetical protein LEP1GSC047_1726 [Leptospira inadai serovar Lyme str. 10]|uniref:Phage tail collar domain protein n=2 Tax=Leptospira inadai serovar Lyme TaxID=293084 RepID=V6H9P2_9LEPT|nr:hypothetical protein [Leptospira inadai]EQA34898.1 hypothetical protein LEP1GSC047_1726 [Leptospira inadai serovar Lyme str. 10]PNV76151.1 phage tail protein [Leptospira inadai serovar Lyme]